MTWHHSDPKTLILKHSDQAESGRDNIQVSIFSMNLLLKNTLHFLVVQPHTTLINTSEFLLLLGRLNFISHCFVFKSKGDWTG